MSPIYTYYHEKYLGAIVRFWNDSFKNMHNFFPINEEVFKARVIEKKTEVESFDPKGLILAIQNEEVIGMIHVGIQSEEVCSVCYRDWPGGNQGYVAFIFVKEDCRRKGVGAELWRQGMQYLEGASRIIIDGQCFNPFYGNSEGPFTPFWGTPEGISIPYEDQATHRFLSKRGFKPRYKAIQLQLEIQTAEEYPLRHLTSQLESLGYSFCILSDRYPCLDLGPQTGLIYPKAYVYESVCALSKGKVVSYICVYLMKELGSDRWAIYEMKTSQSHQGKGLGGLILRIAIHRMKAKGASLCDVLTIPEVSEGGLRVYQSAGFKPSQEWAIY
jgi:ribosomal protein S18 acetylase RimI-like enzyme